MRIPVTPSFFPDAACKGMNPEIFFAHWRDDFEGVRAAKAICSACSVVDECLAWALRVPDSVPGGIAGGQTHGWREAERRRVRKLARAEAEAA